MRQAGIAINNARGVTDDSHATGRGRRSVEGAQGGSSGQRDLTTGQDPAGRLLARLGDRRDLNLDRPRVEQAKDTIHSGGIVLQGLQLSPECLLPVRQLTAAFKQFVDSIRHRPIPGSFLPMVALSRPTRWWTLLHNGAAAFGIRVTASAPRSPYSTVTLLARFRGWSTSVPFCTAVW